MTQDNETFDWSPLGEEWWQQAAAELSMKVSEKQIRFACAKYRGCSDAESARQAGYSGDEESIRQAAYKAARGNAVKALLAFAAAEDGKDAAKGVVDDREVEETISKLIRSGDPNTSIRAIEQYSKLKDKKAALGQSIDGDGFSEWRWVRDMLGVPNGAAMVVLGIDGQDRSLASIPLLHDVYRAVMKESPHVWAAALKKQSSVMRAVLERHLADPDWQNKAEDKYPRSKIWKEIGIDIESSGTRPQSMSSDMHDTVIEPGGDIIGHDGLGDSAWESEQQAS